MNLKNSMKFASRLVVAAALCGAVVFTSCKKDDDEDEVLPSMDGQLSFKLPLYSLVGETYSLNGNSVVSPTEGVTYCWYSKGLIDTVKGQYHHNHTGFACDFCRSVYCKMYRLL